MDVMVVGIRQALAGVVVFSSENAAEDSEDDEEDVEGVPAFLDGDGGLEDVGSEGEKWRDGVDEEE